MKKTNPIVVAQGDELVRIAAQAVFEKIFSQFNVAFVDMGTDARVATNDTCVLEFNKLFRQYHAGIKFSTASANIPGRSSVNLHLRDIVEAMFTLRSTQGKGRYQKQVAVLRYMSGDFYSEQPELHTYVEVNGKKVSRSVSDMIMDYLPIMAEFAADYAREHDLKIIISSKRTISQSRKDFRDPIAQRLTEMGVDFTDELSDDLKAQLPRREHGGFLILAGNADGDDIADILNAHHGTYDMCSTIQCFGGNILEELPGGTDTRQYKLYMEQKDTFHSVLPYILAYCRSLGFVNPEHLEWLNSVSETALRIYDETPMEERETFGMINKIAEACPKFELVEQ